MEGIKHYLTDMDGVIVRGTALIPGAAEFVQRLRSSWTISIRVGGRTSLVNPG